MVPRSFPKYLLPVAFLCCATALIGCGIGTPAAPSPVAIPALHGRVMGGQQPLAGSTVKLYTVGALGNGSAATDILGTGSNGSATFVTSGSDGSIPSVASDIVFDTLNQGWFPMFNGGAIGKVNSDQTLGTSIGTGSGLVYPSELAVDASDRIWTLNWTANFAPSNGNCPLFNLAVFSGGSGGGTPLSTVALGKDLAGCFQFSNGEAFLIDNAGSILIDQVTAYSVISGGQAVGYTGLTRFVGLATPTKTPNTGPPQAP